jgi:phytanoyl-CoA hydroxylase
MSLTPTQVDQYFEQGFLLLPGLFNSAELEGYDRRFLELVNHQANERNDLGGAMKIMRDVMVVKGAVQPASQVHAVNKLLCFEDDPVLFAYAGQAALVGAIRSLLGEEIYSLSSNVFNKPPGVDGRHPMHQDLRYFKLAPADKIIGVWTAILPALRETGCLAVIPGSHKGGMLEHENPDWDYVNAGFYGIEEVDLDKRVHVEMQPGDTLLFHPLLIHGSGRNKSDEFRRAISVHYAASDCVSPNTDWRNNPQTRKIVNQTT